MKAMKRNQKTKTQQLALAAKSRGYKYISSVVKSHYSTTYYHINDIDDVIANGWTPAPRGQYGDWYGRIGTSAVPQNTVAKKALFGGDF